MTSFNKDTWAALFLMFSAALLIWVIIPDQTIPGFEDELQQSFVPRLGAVLIGISAIVMFYNSLRHPFEFVEDEAEDGPLDLIFWSVALGGTVILTLNLATFAQWGFIAGGAILIGSFGLIFNHKALLPITIVVVIIPPILHYLVRFGLGLALP